MTVDPESGIRVLGGSVPYADGSEAELLRVIRDASDRSDGSDELRRHVHDWPTLYHLAPERANLLRPLAVGPGIRVLDVGAGTGCLSRHLGERGAEVVALEPSLARARVAAARCGGLDGVEVVCGTPDDFEDSAGFDVVLVVGVLEYAAAAMGGASGPDSLLARLAGLVRPGGALAVAIENQFALKYLAGLPEDHLGRPWVSIEGYPGPAGVRTHSRPVLARMLARTGLPAQRWLFPFPDYKLPTVVVAEDAYELDEAPDLVDQLVRSPVSDPAFPDVVPVFEPRRAHREMVAAGLGPDVANSFLVIAGADRLSVDRVVDPEALAWLYGSGRLRHWRREQVVTAGQGGVRVRSRTLGDSAPGATWLAQDGSSERAWCAGRTVEQDVLDGLAAHRLDRVTEALTRWRRHLTDLEASPPEGVTHPFLGPGARAVLPEDHLDVEPSNFVVRDDGIVYVDCEWTVVGGVDVDLACTRALRFLAERVVVSGAAHPWSEDITVDGIAAELGRLCDVVVDDKRLARWADAEAQFQEVVTGAPAGEFVPHLTAVGRQSRRTIRTLSA